MTEGKDKAQRRVYVLPSELVERVLEFQKAMGFQSEVEAVRRLLDEALKSRDTAEAIISRFVARLADIRSLRDAAREVLVDHPLVSGINFGEGELQFTMRDGTNARIDGTGKATMYDHSGDLIGFGTSPVPDWASAAYDAERSRKRKKGGRETSLDDEIPF